MGMNMKARSPHVVVVVVVVVVIEWFSVLSCCPSIKILVSSSL